MKQPINLNIKTQSQITNEQQKIINSIYGATKGNIQSKNALDGAINKQSLKQSPGELNALIDRMNEDELRNNLKTLIGRLDGIATRDELIHLIQEIDASNIKNNRHRRLLTQADLDQMTFDEIIDFALKDKLPDRLTIDLQAKYMEKGLTDQQMDRFIELSKKEKANTPPGILTRLEVWKRLFDAGIGDQEQELIIKSIEYRVKRQENAPGTDENGQT